MNDDNGQAPAPEVRVRFGKRPTQIVPVEWAETMLTELALANPSMFGKLLVKASMGDQ